ncbi:pentatricopeptide repeat-containing protein At1g76280 isoform X1 [Dendrobium catenatum]|uniref:Pentatricopeptide repeat-containing protein n=4 Tax=Dendrobium catenatum TaxID=906689 RepID=A0A2I0VEQ2_9ASPA|nr:pentatricopeptide repeat-containing protein At1g76280 isoform X1 [Dendrobium catenatum]XP_020705836.1 pentatricopeptide repeat-containing protein At1g76280 isoform X1 [Dendrobium catenatum]PKU61908.1 Pentatricopeptide repeat-containing protein [Dendrobium catenatum]
MYRYLSRTSCRRQMNLGKVTRGNEIVWRNGRARVQSSQAFSYLWDFRPFGSTNNSGTRDAQIQIINALRLGQRNKAHELLVDLSCMSNSSNVEDFDYILEYCARAPDPLFVMEAWKVMVKNEINMKKKSYRCIILAFSKGGYFKEAFEWITSLEESDHFHACLPLCNIVLRECIYKQSIIDVGRCLELMDNQLMGRSEITYWELLKHYVLQKSLSGVHGLWKDCIKHYNPSIIILRKFIWSFTRLHDLESAYKLLQYMVSLVQSRHVSLRKSAAGRYQSSHLDIPIPPACKLSDEGFRLKENLPFETMFNGKSVKEDDGFMAFDISGKAGCSSSSVVDNLLTVGDIADECFVPNTTDDVFSGIHGSELFGEPKEKGTCSKISSSVAAWIDNQSFKKEKMIEVIGHSTNCLQNDNFDYSILKEAEFIPVFNVLRWSFNDVIQYCALSRTWEQAEFLFLQMQALGVEPSPHTYDGLIKAATQGRALAYGLELINSMERRGMKPYNDTIANLSVELSKILELKKAESLLEMISDSHQKYIHPFNAFLVACDIMDEPERAVRILVKIKCLNIRPNIRTFELLFSLFGNVNAPYERGNWPSHMHAAERIRHIEMGMRRSGVQHSYTSMKNLIRALGMEGMIPEMLQRLEMAEKMLLEMEPHKITDLYNIVLHALVEAGHGLTAIECFQRMRSYGFLIDAATYHIMIECCSLISCFRSALALTSLMLRDGFFPQIMTYTALVKVLLAIDDFQGALDIFNQASSDEIKLDVHLFNEILQQAYAKISSKEVEEHTEGLIDVIETIIEQMHHDKVKPDPSTCTYAFCAYTELDFHSTALEALRVLSLRMISENDDDLHEKRTRFADLVCNEDPDVESKIVSIFKGGDEYLATGLLNLRWCTFMAGHPLSWSPEESVWAQRLSSSYFNRKRNSVHFL